LIPWYWVSVVLNWVGLILLNEQGKMKGVEDEREKRGEEMSAVVVNDGVCAICLDNIELQETALVKGCEHAYWFVPPFLFC